LLSAELDESRRAAVERSHTNDTKASFLVVAAGFLAAITGSGLVEARTWFVGILPLLLTLATVVVAAVVLWPRRLSVPSGPEMVAAWVNADMTAEDLEDHILEVKSKEVKNRNQQNERKAELTSWGFSLLIAAMTTALVVVTVGALVGTWEATQMSDKENPAPEPPSRPDVEVVFREVLGTGDSKPRNEQ
jgi:hypothetical protein